VPDPPYPVSALYDSSILRCSITFNRALVPGPVGGNTVTMRLSNQRHRILAPTAIGSVVRGNHAPIYADPGPNAVFYAPPPFDIRSTPDLTAAFAFSEFPMSTV